MPTGIIIRKAKEEDMRAIADIYAYYVKNTPHTFEEEAPSTLEITRRWRDATDSGLPFLVALADDEVKGYAYAFPYRHRHGYRYTVEESIYIKDGSQGEGIGKSLLKKLISQLEDMQYKQIIAIITMRSGHNEDQVASIGLHKSCGFTKAGHLKKVGHKFDDWMDTVIMQYSVE